MENTTNFARVPRDRTWRKLGPAEETFDAPINVACFSAACLLASLSRCACWFDPILKRLGRSIEEDCLKDRMQRYVSLDAGHSQSSSEMSVIAGRESSAFLRDVRDRTALKAFHRTPRRSIFFMWACSFVQPRSW